MKIEKITIAIVVALAIMLGCNKDDKPNARIVTGNYTVSSWGISGSSYYADIYVSAITQAILDNGAVHTYLSNGSGGWQALPFTTYPTSSYSRTYTPVHYLNGVTIWVSDSDLALPTDPGSRTFKIVAVSEAAALVHEGLDYSNYDEVRDAFNLTE